MFIGPLKNLKNILEELKITHSVKRPDAIYKLFYRKLESNLIRLFDETAIR